MLEARKQKSGITLHNREQAEDLQMCLRSGTINIHVSERTLDRVDEQVQRVLDDKPPAEEKPPKPPTVTEEMWLPAVQEVIDMAVAEKLIKKPAAFRRAVTIEIMRGESGRGGGTRFVIRAGAHFRLSRKKVVEYASITSDKEIGGFIPRDESDVLMWLAMHETAHAIDHWNCRKGGVESDLGHGSEWRYTYRMIRRAFGFVRGEDGYLLSRAI